MCLAHLVALKKTSYACEVAGTKPQGRVKHSYSLPGAKVDSLLKNCFGNTRKCAVQASLVAQLVKNLPAVQETWVLSLAWEDPLEREWLPQYSCLGNPRRRLTEGIGGLPVHGVEESQSRLSD